MVLVAEDTPLLGVAVVTEAVMAGAIMVADISAAMVSGTPTLVTSVAGIMAA